MNKNIESIIKAGIAETEKTGSLLGNTNGEAPIIAEAWGTMKYNIAQYYGVKLDKQACINTCSGIVHCLTACKTGCSSLATGTGNLTSLFLKPGSVSMNIIINALLTYRIGRLYDNLYGPEKLGTASPGFGTEVYKPILGVPSMNEFQNFWRIWRD